MTALESSNVHNSQAVEGASVSIERRMDKEDVVYVYNGIFLSIIPSSSIHVEANGGYLSFLMAEEYSIVYIDHIFFIHSSFDGHRGSIQFGYCGHCC